MFGTAVGHRLFPPAYVPYQPPVRAVVKGDEMTDHLQELEPGLYRWTAPHPDWDPVSDQLDAGYQEVASHLIVGSEAAVFVDPLAPPKPAEPFWRELDEQVAPIRDSLAVVLTLHWHERSASEFGARYAAPVYAPAGAANDIEHRPLETYVPKPTLPAEEAGRQRTRGQRTKPPGRRPRHCPSGSSLSTSAGISKPHSGSPRAVPCSSPTSYWAPSRAYDCAPKTG
ncbi:MAG TPA: hypothetical protein VFE20_06750 [Thermoleophilia bacterium]|nr:hypothetical protein [Thermoleophilia bacterium]